VIRQCGLLPPSAYLSLKGAGSENGDYVILRDRVPGSPSAPCKYRHAGIGVPFSKKGNATYGAAATRAAFRILTGGVRRWASVFGAC
jgi:hypothetical protein